MLTKSYWQIEMNSDYLNTIISGISYSLPSRKVENIEIFSLNKNIDPQKIPNKYGVETRYWSSDNENFFSLALESTKKLLESSSTKPQDIEFVILLTQSGHNKLPSQVHKLSSDLNLNDDVFAIEISQGCAGLIYGLKLASSLRNSYKKGVIILGDTYSKILNTDDKASLPIFGDGVASMLVENVYQNVKKGIVHTSFKFINKGKSFDKLICGPGTNQKLFMDGPAVFNFVLTDIQKLMKTFDLLSYDEIYIHQASKYTFDTLVGRLGISHICPSNLSKYGNMTSASIPILMAQSRFTDKTKGKFLMCGFGVGLSAGACEYVIG